MLSLLLLIITLIYAYNTFILKDQEESKWERDTKKEYKVLKKKYGKPNTLNPKSKGCAIWNESSTIAPFSKIAVNDDTTTTSYYPFPRKTMIQHTLPFEIKDMKILPLLFSITDCISYDPLKKELISVGESEKSNIASLTFILMIINRKVQAPDALKQQLHGQLLKNNNDMTDEMIHQIMNPAPLAPPQQHEQQEPEEVTQPEEPWYQELPSYNYT